MTPQEKQAVLRTLIDGDEQFDGMIELTIERIENVLAAEAELNQWADDFARKRAVADVYGGEIFLISASL